MDGYFLSKSRRMKDKKRRGRNALSFVIHTIMCCQLWCFSKVAFLAHTFISSFFARVTVVIACEMSFPETETPFTRTTLYQYQRLNECPETEAKKNKIIIPWLTRHPLSKLHPVLRAGWWRKQMDITEGLSQMMLFAEWKANSQGSLAWRKWNWLLLKSEKGCWSSGWLGRQETWTREAGEEPREPTEEVCCCSFTFPLDSGSQERNEDMHLLRLRTLGWTLFLG